MTAPARQWPGRSTARPEEPPRDGEAVDAAATDPAPLVPHLPMVGWYGPGQLAATGVEVAISTIFGRHSDHRLVEGMAAGDGDAPFYEYACHYTDDGKAECHPDPAQQRDGIWIDYVADVGDGRNSTRRAATLRSSCRTTVEAVARR